MLTSDQMTDFEVRGYLHLPRAFEPAEAQRMADFVWERLADLRGIRRDDPESWNVDAPWFGLNKFKNDPVFNAIASEALCGAIDDLLGAGAWRKPKHWGGFLVSFSGRSPDQWTVPNKRWHVDSHFTYEPETLFGLRVFVFLSDVAPRGGGTLVVSGSQRLVKRFVSRLTPQERIEPFADLLRRFTACDPWLEELTSGTGPDRDRVERFMGATHEIDGVTLRVEQFCGSPGDVVIAHPWILHVASPNAGDRPRFMLAKYVFPEHPRPAQRTRAHRELAAPMHGASA